MASPESIRAPLPSHCTSTRCLLKGAAACDCGPCGAKGERGVEDVGVVAALVGSFSLQEDMGVRIDEAGKDGRMGEVNDGGSGGNFGRCCVRYALDAIAANQDDLVAARLVGLAVDQGASADDGDLRWGGRCRLLRGGIQNQCKKRNAELDFQSSLPRGTVSGCLRVQSNDRMFWRTGFYTLGSYG